MLYRCAKPAMDGWRIHRGEQKEKYVAILILILCS